MRRVIIFISLIVLAAIVLAACGTPTPRATRPAQLPTAVPPDPNLVQPGTGGWAISFLYEFPSDFWEPGPHRYSLTTVCPIMPGGGQQAVSQNFDIDENASMHDGSIYFRLSGMSTGPLDSIQGFAALHPSQATAAVVTFVGLPEESLDLVAERCEAVVAWDGLLLVEVLEPQEPYQP